MPRRYEDGLQRAAIELCNRKYRRDLMAYHTPNGGYRTRIEAARLQGLGVLAGVPDITLAIRGGRLGYIELKTPKGRLSTAQIIFRAAAEGLGIPWVVCRSISEVDEAVKSILEESRNGTNTG